MKFIGSPNFDFKTKRTIKYIIIHYTGMKNQAVAIKRLQSKVAKVSCHYLVSKTGKIYQMVKDYNVAWHAGKSKWGKDENLNKNSIGIELVNKGSENYPNAQIKSLIYLLKKLRAQYKIKPQNLLGHEDVAPKRKVDPGPLFPWSLLFNQGLSKKR